MHKFFFSSPSDFKLHISPSNMANQNTPEYLEKIKTRLFENLRMLPHAPGVQVQAIPEDGIHESEEDEDKINPEERIPQSEKVVFSFYNYMFYVLYIDQDSYARINV